MSSLSISLDPSRDNVPTILVLPGNVPVPSYSGAMVVGTTARVTATMDAATDTIVVVGITDVRCMYNTVAGTSTDVARSTVGSIVVGDQSSNHSLTVPSVANTLHTTSLQLLSSTVLCQTEPPSSAEETTDDAPSIFLIGSNYYTPSHS